MHRALRGGDSPRLGHHSGTSVDAAHPYLNIHSASFSGNLGLVSYAISSGVSPSAVLDGITPLHAACASQLNNNNDAVVNYLIEHGADVNAVRGGSRRASAESVKTPRIGGAVGYTPLHFAVSAGHTNLVPILLSAGADPSIPDKHGMLPHQLAKKIGKGDVEGILFDALMKKASTSGSSGNSANVAGSTGPLPPPPTERSEFGKRLIVKKSLESIRHASSKHQQSFDSQGHSDSSDMNRVRQPSFPDLAPTPSHLTRQQRDRDLPPSPPPRSFSPARYPTPHGKCKRPRSAGADAEDNGAGSPAQSVTAGVGTLERNTGRKLGTKYSLLNVLRRNTDDPQDFGSGLGSMRECSNSYPSTPPNQSYLSQFRERKASNTPSSPDSPGPHTSTFALNTSTSPTYQPRPGILRTHRRSSSSLFNQANVGSSPGLSVVTSTEVSRKPSTRTLRFEDQAPPSTPSVPNGGSGSLLPSGNMGMGNRKTSDASAVSTISGSSDRGSASVSGRGSEHMMVRKPSDHSIFGMEDDSSLGIAPGVGENMDPSTKLKRLALANSNRARAGTFSTVASGGTGQTSGSEPLDIPGSSKDRDGRSSSNASPSYGISSSPSSSAPPSSPGPDSGGVGFAGDPDVPDYSSELSGEEDEALPPEVPSKDSPGPPAPLQLKKKRINRKSSRTTNDSSGLPSSAKSLDDEEHAQYARYVLDGESEFDLEDEDGRSRTMWSSPGSYYGLQRVTSPFSALSPGKGSGTSSSSLSRNGSIPGIRSDSLPHPRSGTIFVPISGSTPSSAGTISASSPTFSIRSHREARNLVQQVQKEILANAQVSGKNLSEQLAAYGETLAIERRFAIGERQRWRNTAKEEDDEDEISSQAPSQSGGERKEGIEEDERVESESERQLKERADIRIRERKLQGSIGYAPSYGSLQRVKGGVKPKPKPLVNRRPHTSSGTSGSQVGGENIPTTSSGGHRSTRSATAPVFPRRPSSSETRNGNESGIEIVQTVPTPPGSSSPASTSSPSLEPGSDIQSYSFAPSSPLRMSLNENGDLDEPEHPSRVQVRALNNGSSIKSNKVASGYEIDTKRSASMSANTSTLSPILSESSSAASYAYPIKRKSKAPPVTASITASPAPLNVSRSPKVYSSHERAATLPTPSPSSTSGPAHESSALDFAPLSVKIPRKSTGSDQSGRSANNSDTALTVGPGSIRRGGMNGLNGSIKSEKKGRFGVLKTFVQTIKGAK